MQNEKEFVFGKENEFLLNRFSYIVLWIYALTVNCSDISKLISTIHDLWYLEYSIFKVYIYIYI